MFAKAHVTYKDVGKRFSAACLQCCNNMLQCCDKMSQIILHHNVAFTTNLLRVSSFSLTNITESAKIWKSTQRTLLLRETVPSFDKWIVICGQPDTDLSRVPRRVLIKWNLGWARLKRLKLNLHYPFAIWAPGKTYFSPVAAFMVSSFQQRRVLKSPDI